MTPGTGLDSPLWIGKWLSPPVVYVLLACAGLAVSLSWCSPS